jgi:hypothetical protein
VAFVDMVSELAGRLPGLSPLLAEKFINYAWRDVCRQRIWSFLVADGALVCPAQVIDGTFAITQFSDQVTADATASAALLALPATPGLASLQIRFGGATGIASPIPAVGQVYNIRLVDATNPAALVLTLDRVVLEATTAAATYQVYRCYVLPPTTDFLAWSSVVDIVNGWRLRLHATSIGFDGRDPQRQAQGQAYYLGACRSNAVLDASVVPPTTTPHATSPQGTPIYELWPHPTSGQAFYVRFRRRGQPLVLPTDDLPPQIDEQLVIERALAAYGYPFAQANQANFPSFRNAGWVSLTQQAHANYLKLLLDAKRQDDEQALQTVWSRGHGLRTRRHDFKGISDFPIDSNFMQQHLLQL